MASLATTSLTLTLTHTQRPTGTTDDMNIMTIKNWPALFSHIITHTIANANEKKLFRRKRKLHDPASSSPNSKRVQKTREENKVISTKRKS